MWWWRCGGGGGCGGGGMVTYLHLCFFSNVCNISVKLLMYMRTNCIPMYQNIQFHPRLRCSHG